VIIYSCVSQTLKLICLEEAQAPWNWHVVTRTIVTKVC